MHSRMRSVSAVLIVGICISCELSLSLSPVVSGTLQTRNEGSRNSIALSSEQVTALTSWFTQHKSGWSKSPASYLPGDKVFLHHADGRLTMIDLNPNGFIVVNTGSDQFIRQFGAPEFAVLNSILNR